jgi:cephalosporin hydroxylase
MEATEEFLARCPEFVRDADGEKFLLTFNPGGLLRRVR